MLNAYQLIITIDNNEELIKTKEQQIKDSKNNLNNEEKELNYFQERIKQLNIFQRREKKELEEKLTNLQEQLEEKQKNLLQIQTEITQLTTENETLINQIKEQRLQKLQERLKQLEEEKETLIKRISFLEEQILESERLIKEQKTKIVPYLLFTENEKQSLEELITIHKSYQEAKKYREDEEWELCKQVFTLRQQLETKLGKNFNQVIGIILTNFEELYENEWRLQQQLAEKKQITITQQLLEENIAKMNLNISNLTLNAPLNIVKEGYLITNCEFGDNTKFDYKQITANYATKVEENEEELFTTQIEQPPKQ